VLDFAGSGVLLGLAASGLSRETAPLLNKNNLDARDVRAINAVFARAARAVLAQTKALAASGSVEIAALPAYEPIVPLIVDAAGRTRQEANTVNVGGRTDAVAAVDDGMLAATALAGAANPGIISPHGAYDDEAGAVLQERHPAYAVFSDRVAKAATGASAEAVNASKAAALHSYLLETSKTAKLPILFCSDTLSSAIDVLPAATAPAALGDRIRDTARDALALSSPNDATILTLCLDLDSPLLQRADRGAVLAHLDAVLSGTGGLEATTPRQFLRRHPASADTYGFEPATDAGGFALWMGSGNQASLWTALSDARSSAGGDAAVTHPAIRAALLRAESNRWFMALSLPQPRAATERLLAQFRSAIAQVYRAANVPVPAEIAPVKWDHPASIATPPPARV
jgi:alpha-amylase/alpha-mannosidase (GH57 family)